MNPELVKQKVQKLVEMGERVHTLARLGQLNDAELLALSKQLTEIDKEVNASYGKKPPVREHGICPACNAAFEGAFCGGCGLNIDEYFSKPALVCATCGFIIGEDDVFCGVCGIKKGA